MLFTKTERDECAIHQQWLQRGHPEFFAAHKNGTCRWSYSTAGNLHGGTEEIGYFAQHLWEQLGSEILHSVHYTKKHKFRSHRKRRKKEKLKERVLEREINLFQKFKVENNFDLDEMDESKKRKKEKGSFTFESWFWALLSLDRFKYLSRINILTYEVPHLSGVRLERNLYTLCEYLNRFLSVIAR